MKKDNIPGFPGYYISKRGRVFSRIELKPQGNLKGVNLKDLCRVALIPCMVVLELVMLVNIL